jgi:hypothetical protein
MSEAPFVLGKSEGVPGIAETMQELQEYLEFLLKEWKGADEYLNSIGYTAHKTDEYGDLEFVTLEERVKEAVQNG